MKPRYKIVVGPTQMCVKRYDYKSEPIDIGEEHIDCYNQQAKDFYYEYMHAACQKYIELKWSVNRIQWGILKREVSEIVDDYPTMYFDGPEWIASTVPWKQAKYKEWFIVPKKMRWLLKREYTDGIRNRSETTSSVPPV